MAKVPQISTMISEESVHVDMKLIELARGIWKPSQSELDTLVDHFSRCAHCDFVLQQLIVVQKESQEAEGYPGKQYQQTLSQLEKAIHQVHDYNTVAAYIETLEREGTKQANELFPILAAHIKFCKRCQRDISEIQETIDDMIKEGLIAPLEAKSHF